MARLAKRLCLVLLAAFGLAALTSCDVVYDLSLENMSQQEVIVTVYQHPFQLEPCSVQTVHGIAYAPGPVPIEVKTAAGEIVLTTMAEPKKNEKGFPELTVQVPPGNTGDCPQPVSGEFLLRVENYAQRDVTIWLKGQAIGSVESGSTRTLGPLPGAWETARSVQARDLEGKSLKISLGANYRLGEIPEFRLGVVSW